MGIFRKAMTEKTDSQKIDDLIKDVKSLKEDIVIIQDNLFRKECVLKFLMNRDNGTLGYSDPEWKNIDKLIKNK